MEVSRILFFLVPPQVLTIFSLKTLPEPEEVPKNQSLEVKILPKPEEVPKKGVRLGGLKNFVFFGTQKKNKVSEVLGLEVSPSPRPPKLWVFLVFFGTSSGFGKIFTSRLWFGWYLLRFRQHFP